MRDSQQSRKSHLLLRRSGSQTWGIICRRRRRGSRLNVQQRVAGRSTWHLDIWHHCPVSSGVGLAIDLLYICLHYFVYRLIVLLLIRKSIASLKQHLEKVTDRLPYHYDDELLSNHSATSPPLHTKDTTMETMVGPHHGDAEVVL